MKKVIIHSDGGCHGNPGPGGWAAVLKYGEHQRELSGGVPATTNNRMELQAAIEALNALKEPCAVEFYTDSEYVRNGITAWLFGWKRNGWKTKDKLPVKNEDLWRALDAAKSRHLVNWHWVKGHAGNGGNERCDRLAQKAIRKIKKNFGPSQLKTLVAQFRKQPYTQPAVVREEAKASAPAAGLPSWNDAFQPR
ncbi:MAG TPA: ribonuclease HI, partial [Verrucomicrobiae bacterium]